MKWDGHTHSQFCRHGSGDKTALMVEKAIELGFQRYSIVEHAPLPDGIIEDAELRRDFGLLLSEMDDYFDHLESLKRCYQDRIHIMAGLEIDYFEGLEDFSAGLIADCSDRLDDIVLSLHFLKGKDGFKPLDFKPEVFREALLDYYGSYDLVQTAYWEAINRMVGAELDLPETKRIGHLGLIYKYADLFDGVSEQHSNQAFFENLLRRIRKNGWALDFNVAGLKQKWYQNLYLTEPMIYWTRRLQIAIVYGSDAHSVEAVGQHYDTYLQACRSQT